MERIRRVSQNQSREAALLPPQWFRGTRGAHRTETAGPRPAAPAAPLAPKEAAGGAMAADEAAGAEERAPLHPPAPSGGRWAGRRLAAAGAVAAVAPLLLGAAALLLASPAAGRGAPAALGAHSSDSATGGHQPPARSVDCSTAAREPAPVQVPAAAGDEQARAPAEAASTTERVVPLSALDQQCLDTCQVDCEGLACIGPDTGLQRGPCSEGRCEGSTCHPARCER
ncbi:unnamed protein product [Prorocentrum cordatum]|uniref:Uncharacterized protein n=1 Tax=Prorocentrum cordatum TaxID=2364126 RepID=A0ABN9YBU3_9DINO|nr:unnamed protein product [Polarella glacialis]